MSLKRQIFTYAMAYVMLVFSVLFGVLVLSIGRETVMLGMAYTVRDDGTREQFYQSLRLGAVAQWSTLLMGLIVLIMLVALESIYRNGVSTGSVWKSFFLVTGIECGVLFISHAASFLMKSGFSSQGWLSIALPLIEAMLTGLFLWMAFNLQRVTDRIKQSTTT